MQTIKRYHYLDSLRGVAAIMVVLFHASFHATPESLLVTNGLVQKGYLFVDFFFVLSGFVIALSYWSALGSIADFGRFQMKRAARLLPLHWVVLLIYLGIELWLSSLSPGLFGTQPFSINDAGALLSNLVLLQTVTEPVLTFNRAAWSISAEFWVYAGFGLLCVLTTGRRQVLDGLCLGLVILGLWVFFQRGSMDETQGLGMLRCAMGFGLGVLVFRLHSRIQISVAGCHATAAGVIAVLVFRAPLGVNEAVFPPLFALLVLALVCSGASRVKTFLMAPTLQLLGRLSFSIYMLHLAVMFGLSLACNKVLGVALRINPYSHDLEPHLGVMGQTALTIAVLAVTIGLSYLTYRFIEQPCNKIGRKWSVRLTDAEFDEVSAKNPGEFGKSFP